jgi:hypothetical protein
MTTTNKIKNPLDLETLVLKNGAHKRRDQGVCLMEAVAWIAGEKHSDRPECTDVALAAFGRAFNDRLSNDERQLLRARSIERSLASFNSAIELTEAS